MVKGASCFRPDRYADGAEIMIGDRVSKCHGIFGLNHMV